MEQELQIRVCQVDGCSCHKYPPVYMREFGDALYPRNGPYPKWEEAFVLSAERGGETLAWISNHLPERSTGNLRGWLMLALR